MHERVVTPVSYDSKTGYIVDAGGFNIAHCYVHEWALELVELINDTADARGEAMKMANAIDGMYRDNPESRAAIDNWYGLHHGPFITKMRDPKANVGG
jgi:hypothetical protein